MGTVLEIFPRQTLIAANGVGFASYYSEPACVRRFSAIRFEFQLFGLMGTSPRIDTYLETAAELKAANWTVAVTIPPMYSAPTIAWVSLREQEMSRFLRARIHMQPGDAAATVFLIGMARH